MPIIATGSLPSQSVHDVRPALSALPPTPIDPPAPDAPWVVCLCAAWCGSCNDYRPLFAQVARAHPQLRFAWVDIEDHAELADAFDVETFPTLLVADARGTRFLGPLLPHAQTLSRLLAALPAAQPASAHAAHVAQLLAALEATPAPFAIQAF